MALEVKNPYNPTEFDEEEKRKREELVSENLLEMNERWKREGKEKADQKKRDEEKRKSDEERFKKLTSNLAKYFVENVKSREELNKFVKTYATASLPGLQILGKLGIDVFKEIGQLPQTLKNIKNPKFWEKQFTDTRTLYEKKKERLGKGFALRDEIAEGGTSTKPMTSLLGGLSQISPIFKAGAGLMKLLSPSLGFLEKKLLNKYGTKDEKAEAEGKGKTGAEGAGEVRGGMTGILTNFVFSNKYQLAQDVYFKRMVKGLSIIDGKVSYGGVITKKKEKKEKQIKKKPSSEELAKSIKSKKGLAQMAENMAKYKGLPFPPQALAQAVPYILAGVGIGLIVLYFWNMFQIYMERNAPEWLKTLLGGHKANLKVAEKEIKKKQTENRTRFQSEIDTLKASVEAEPDLKKRENKQKALDNKIRNYKSWGYIEDAIITKTGQIIHTHPDDNIIATKTSPIGGGIRPPDNSALLKEFSEVKKLMKKLIAEVKSEVKKVSVPPIKIAYSPFLSKYAEGNI